MTTNNLAKNDMVFLSSQKENGYSYDYQSINPDYACEPSNENEKIEPFDCEKDALEFANFYSQKVLNEKR